MNWVGELVQKHIHFKDSVLDLGCGVMQSTMDTCKSYPPTRLTCGELLGVDNYEPYLEFLRLRGIKTQKHNLEEMPLPFWDKSWDHVLLLDILEHMLSIQLADRLLSEAKRIAIEKVFVVTPKKFFRNNAGVKSPFPYRCLGENKLQLHHCFLPRVWLEHRDLKILRGNPASRVLFAMCGE